jgi:hypothetical protein
MMETDDTISIPDGWTSDKSRDGRHTYIRGVGGYVTVNWERREFCGGISSFRLSKRKYAGRGWRESLVADAVAWLQSVSTSRAARAKERP